MNTVTTSKNRDTKFNYFQLLLISILSFTFMSGCTNVTDDKKAADYNSELGVRYLQQGRLKLANQKLLKSLEQNSNSPQSNHYYALLQAKLGVSDKAHFHFKKAIALTPSDPELRNNYGSFLCKTSQPHSAVPHFLAAIKNPLYSTPEFAYTNAGICLRKAGRKNDAQAEKYFRLALKKKSSFPSALIEMAKLYKDRRDYSKAQAFMMRYETVGKSSPEALQLCTVINSKINDHAKASSCRSALLRIFPSSAEAEAIGKAL